MKTRRWLALVLTICLVFSLSASALAAELSMSADRTTLQAGETVTLTLTVSESLTGPMDGVAVHFNGDLFELTGTQLENPFELGALQTGKDGSKYYTVSFMRTDENVAVAAGAFARLTFRALSTVNSEELGSFYFTDDGWMDEELEQISMTIIAGGKTSPITVTVTHVHSYDAGVVTTPAGCTTEGVMTYTCSTCGDSYTEAIAAKGHSYDAGGETTPAGCTTAGVMTYTCSACGDSYTEAIPAKGHTEVTDKAIPATCTETGLTEGKHCSACGEILAAQVAVPATGHSYDAVKVTTPAGCTTEGVKTYTCSACGDSYTEAIAAKGHTEVKDEAIPATCTEAGKTEGKHCSTCGAILLAQEELPAIGHSYGDFVVTRPASTTCTGEQVKTCSLCGHEVMESIPLVKLDKPVLKSVAVTKAGVKVTWNAVEGANKYTVWYKTAGGSWQKGGTASGTSYTVTGLKSGTTYSFTVRCVSDDGKTNISSYDSKGLSITYVAAPALTGVSLTATGVKVKWNAVTGANKYTVWYRVDGGSWQKGGTTSGTSYTVTGLKSGTTYSFTVRCVSDDGKTNISAYDSKGLSIRYVAAPVLKSVTKTSSGVKVSWGAVTGAGKYTVWYKTSGGSWTKGGMTSGTSYTVTGLKSGTTYSFTVRCVSDDGKTNISSYDSKGLTLTY